jgi:polyribonucleotide nucleotidyltransferase
MIHSHEFEVGGKTFSLETGRVAKQAGGAVLLGMGETVLLGTATMSKNPRPGIDFLPLTCDYEERKYAVGKIPGGFIKRGGRPSEKSILVSRLIDRPLRPLFPKGLRNDLQVIVMTFAVEQDCPPDILAVTAAGAALAVSDVPFNGPIAGVRVGLIDGEFILFPTNEQLKVSELDLCVAGHKGAISMVEAGASEVSEETMIKALKIAHDAINTICVEIEKFASKVAKPKREVTLHEIDKKLLADIDKTFGKEIAAAIGNPDKATRESALDDVIKDIIEKCKVKYAGNDEYLGQLAEASDKVVKDTVRKLIINDDKRPDGRKLDEIRNLEAVAGLLPRVHGSGMFTRGQTQVMTVATLGMPKDAQMMDGIEDVEDKRYMHFYNFPPYSVGETRPMRGPGRREVGHGALAERSLIPVLPFDNPDFPYTLLLISEVLESNGSTSMASVCGSTLALMDAGVPIKAPVAGIAMGLMSDGKKFKVLTDIQGMEDFCGDMDFKVAGTRKGITALQLDTKLEGIPDKVLADALKQAQKARFEIIDVIEEEIAAPRDMNPNAPRVTTVQINPEKIGALIGPGGANIRKITTETGAEIDIQQDGRVLIASEDGNKVLAAIEMVKAVTASAEVGSEFKGTVSRLMGRGALVEYMPGKDGLIPTNLITVPAPGRPDDALSVGDVVNVRVIEVDAQGRVNLTALGLEQDLPALAANATADPDTKPSFGDRGGDRGGRGGDRGGRDRDRGGRGGGFGRDRGGDRGDRGGDRGPREERSDRGPREERPARVDDAPKPERAATRMEDDTAPTVPDSFPKKKAAEDVNARFRPRR